MSFAIFIKYNYFLDFFLVPPVAGAAVEAVFPFPLFAEGFIEAGLSYMVYFPLVLPKIFSTCF